MGTNDSELPDVSLDERDTAAVVAILIRAARAGAANTHDQAIIEEANARIAANTDVLNKAASALTFFGFQPPASGSIWDQVWNAIGQEAYMQALAIARGEHAPSLFAQASDGSSSIAEERRTMITTRDVPVRNAILRHLRAVGSRGTTVREVKRHLADAYGMTVHEKTPGMTLYRLSKEGLARREGRTWYATEEAEDENEAPAGLPLGASEPALDAQ